NVVGIACGAQHSMALRANGTLAIWGDTNQGQRIPPAGLQNVAAIAAGGGRCLALVGDGPPILTTPLVDRIITFGSTAFLRVNAVGAGPLSYQWRLDGNDLDGATNALLTLTNVLFSQAGTYSVVVSNAFGKISVGNMDLKVDWLFIANQPQNTS